MIDELLGRLRGVDGADGIDLAVPMDPSDDADEVLIGGYVSPEGREQAQAIIAEYDDVTEGPSYEVDEFEWFLSVDVKVSD